MTASPHASQSQGPEAGQQLIHALFMKIWHAELDGKVLCSLAYSIVVRRIPANDSITSCAMESVNPGKLNSTYTFPNGYFAYTQRGCCGGHYPNFFTSYPTGLQVTGAIC